ncbi:uncharacterized protein RBU33_009215 [Hipposideros larvatus]
MEGNFAGGIRHLRRQLWASGPGPHATINSLAPPLSFFLCEELLDGGLGCFAVCLSAAAQPTPMEGMVEVLSAPAIFARQGPDFRRRVHSATRGFKRFTGVIPLNKA